MKRTADIFCCDKCDKFISEKEDYWGTSSSSCGVNREPRIDAGKCCKCGTLLCEDCLIVVKEEPTVEVVSHVSRETITRRWYHWSFWCAKDWRKEKQKLKRDA